MEKTAFDCFELLWNQLMDEHISPSEFFFHAIIRSAEATQKGFETMMEAKNYLCAIPMIRQQVDCCLISFAYHVCEDPDVFFNQYASGKPINQLKSFDKELLTNRYLYEKLDNNFAGLKDLYKKLCKFVHPSEEHFKATLMGAQQGQLILKSWDNSAPIDYSPEQMVADMDFANNVLINLIFKYIKEKKEFLSQITIKETRPINIEDLPEREKKTINILLGKTNE